MKTFYIVASTYQEAIHEVASCMKREIEDIGFKSFADAKAEAKRCNTIANKNFYHVYTILIDKD